MLKPYPYQEQGIDFLLSNKACLLADEQGLGKTIQVVLARNSVVTENEKTLVICPAAVKYNWSINFEKHAAFNKTQIINSSRTILNKDADVVITNYEYLHKLTIKKQLLGFGFKYIVIDEAHYLAHGGAKRTQHLLNAKYGILKDKSFDHVWLLTGTPMTNRPIDLYTILRVFASRLLGDYKDYRRFAHKFCGARLNDYGGLDTKGATNLALLHTLIKPFYLRREKKDVLPELPEKFVKVVYFEPSKRINKLENCVDTYRQMLEEGKDLGQTSTLRREIALEKLTIVKDYIVNNVERPAVLFYHHKTVGDELSIVFPDAIRIDGEDNAESKQKKIELFKEHKNILLAQMTSCGTGIDGLQEVCNKAVVVEIPWAPGALGQAIDRLHRIGQKQDVHIELLVLHKCFDEQVYKALQRKQKHIDEVIVADKTKKGEDEMSGILEQINGKLTEILDNQKTILGAASNAKMGATKTEMVGVQGVPKAETTAPTTTAMEAPKAPIKKAPKKAAEPKTGGPSHAELQQTAKELGKKFMDDYQNESLGTRTEGKTILMEKILPEGKNTTTCSTPELQEVVAKLSKPFLNIISEHVAEETGDPEDEETEAEGDDW
jgi:SWI/SNF-related matrix-associated actin-dependent regulator 1 of chromatin subfamily A